MSEIPMPPGCGCAPAHRAPDLASIASTLGVIATCVRGISGFGARAVDPIRDCLPDSGERREVRGGDLIDQQATDLGDMARRGRDNFGIAGFGQRGSCSPPRTWNLGTGQVALSLETLGRVRQPGE